VTKLCVRTTLLWAPGTPVFVFASLRPGQAVRIELLEHPEDCPCEWCEVDRLDERNRQMNELLLRASEHTPGVRFMQ
jgi:hypothetical protein